MFDTKSPFLGTLVQTKFRSSGPHKYRTYLFWVIIYVRMKYRTSWSVPTRQFSPHKISDIGPILIVLARINRPYFGPGPESEPTAEPPVLVWSSVRFLPQFSANNSKFLPVHSRYSFRTFSAAENKVKILEEVKLDGILGQLDVTISDNRSEGERQLLYMRQGYHAVQEDNKGVIFRYTCDHVQVAYTRDQSYIRRGKRDD